MNGSQISFSQEQNTRLRPREIEQALQALWRDIDGADGALMHVRTLNLLAFVPAARYDSEIEQAIQTIAVQHPGRTIAMRVVHGAQPPSAQVTIACRVGNGGKQLCGEQITITSGDDGAPLPSVAAGLLVAGVPTFLWWLGDPPLNSPLYDSFVEVVDRVIVDSRTWSDPLATIRDLVVAIERAQPAVAYSDLQWTALTPWRRQTAQCFDLPDALPHLARLHTLTIAHGPATADRLAALLFLGWLATRLGWKITAHDGDRLTLATPATTIAATIAPRDGVDGLHYVMLTSPDARIELRHNPTTHCITTTIALGSAPPIGRMAKLLPRSLAVLVGEELDMLQRDAGYESAARFAAHLLAAR